MHRLIKLIEGVEEAFYLCWQHDIINDAQAADIDYQLERIKNIVGNSNYGEEDVS